MSDDEINAIKEYTGTRAFGQINSKLRGKTDDWGDDRNSQTVNNLDSAINKYTLQEDITAWHGVNGDLFDGMDTGDSFVDNGYASTSLSKSVATIYADVYDSANPAIIRVVNRAGQSGGYLAGMSKFPGEKEFVLPRSTKLRLVSITEDQDSGYPIYNFVRD